MRQAFKDFRPVRNMLRLALERRKQGRMRTRLWGWWVPCDSTSPSEARRCVILSISGDGVDWMHTNIARSPKSLCPK